MRPAVALGAGALVVAVFAAITGLQVTVHALDETVYKFAAVQHANDVPFGFLHENTSRGVARLYSFIVVEWIDRGFGQLSEERLMVGAATLIIVGVQVFFSSFLLSILGLRRAR